MKHSKRIMIIRAMLVTMVMLFAAMPVLAAIDLLTGDDSTFDSSLGGWTTPGWMGAISWDNTEGNTALGSMKLDGNFDDMFTVSVADSACSNIDYASWPDVGGQKLIYLSGYAKNVSTTQITANIFYYANVDCAGGFNQALTMLGGETSWTPFVLSFDLASASSTPQSVRVEITGYSDFFVEEDGIFFIDDVKLGSVAPNAVTMQGMAAQGGAWLPALAVLSLGGVSLVLLRKRHTWWAEFDGSVRD